MREFGEMAYAGRHDHLRKISVLDPIIGSNIMRADYVEISEDMLDDYVR